VEMLESKALFLLIHIAAQGNVCETVKQTV